MAFQFNKTNPFVEEVAEGVHNLETDQLKVALTATDPTNSVATFSEITEPLGDANFVGDNPFNITTTSSSQTDGTYKLVCEDLTLEASADTEDFRYIVLYNDTATNKEVIGYYDYGQTISLLAGETFQVNLDQSNGVITLN